MKKVTKLFLLTLAAALVLSILGCATSKDFGVYNPKGVTEADFAALTIDKKLSVGKIDNESVKWDHSDFWSGALPSTVRIAPGAHVFEVTYRWGNQFSFFPRTVIGNFEGNKEYEIRCTVNGNMWDVDIYEIQDGKAIKVTFDPKSLQGGDTGAIPAYVKYVLNPRMENVGNTVRLENDESVLTFLPDMSYTLRDKKTGKETAGMAGFNMNMTMTEGTVYLLETEAKMNKDAFLKTKYTENAQTVLVPVKCDAQNVTYRYSKPAEIAGTEITFSITEIVKK
jgi:hypothetical protein